MEEKDFCRGCISHGHGNRQSICIVLISALLSDLQLNECKDDDNSNNTVAASMKENTHLAAQPPSDDPRIDAQRPLTLASSKAAGHGRYGKQKLAHMLEDYYQDDVEHAGIIISHV